jgi:hypothetical protein
MPRHPPLLRNAVPTTAAATPYQHYSAIGTLE